MHEIECISMFWGSGGAKKADVHRGLSSCIVVPSVRIITPITIGTALIAQRRSADFCKLRIRQVQGRTINTSRIPFLVLALLKRYLSLSAATHLLDTNAFLSVLKGLSRKLMAY